MTERKQKIYRYVAVFMAINILAEVFSPTVAFALTGGPSQPEVESFEPADTNQMVDLFSGDFNYNIPLLTVPGPNGGYPVNLAYHAGIGMEQEASWVGLGWNINPGVINRNMRGLPDDFNGDVIEKITSMKPDITWGVQADLLGILQPGNRKTEIFGYELGPSSPSNALTSMNLGLTYNNYKGVGITSQFQFSWGMDIIKKADIKGFLSVSGNYDTQGGLTLSPGTGLGYYNFKAGLQASINSKQGLVGYGYNISLDGYNESTKPFVARLSKLDVASWGQNFAVSSYIPSNQLKMEGRNQLGQIKVGTEFLGIFKNIALYISKTEQKVESTSQYFKAYGYNYLQNRSGSTMQKELSDYNRSSENPVTENAPALAMPVLTNDVYLAKAQGMGGVFRANRSDVGLLYEPSIESEADGTEQKTEIEGGAGNIFHIGTNIEYINNSHQYSGIWQGQMDELKNDFNFRSGDNSVYYRFNGETYTDEGQINNVNTIQKAKKFQITSTPYDGDAKKKFFIPKLLNYDDAGVNVYTNGMRSKRKKSVNNIEYRTFEQIKKGISGTDYKGLGKHQYTPLGTPTTWDDYNNQFGYYNYSSSAAKIKAHHNAEISVLNSSGYRYVYGIPVYNNSQKDVMFTSGAGIAAGSSNFNGLNGTSSGYATRVTSSYDAADASGDNNEGIDNYYNANIMPAYAHSYLLTTVYSPDYVDLTNDGPSEDDFGYYVKFNYEKVHDDYKWRVPFTEGTLLKSHYSNLNDDKINYTYGGKEIWYLNSIETKTHVAIFKLKSENREDSRGPNTEHNFSTGTYKNQYLEYLEKIDLYNKKDLVTSLKTINFEYDYSLCQGIPNGASGKLTLKKVWFSYLGNSKGRLSPYIFDYNAGDDDANPDYAMNNMDRWGNYKATPYTRSSNQNCTVEDYPYTYQNDDYNHNNTIDASDLELRNKHASAWCLRKITLPSGGDISIDYEQDDYAYVEQKKATEMFEIAGTAESISGTFPEMSNLVNISKDRSRIYFHLKTNPVTGNPENTIAKYIPAENEEGKRYIYFKAYVELKSTLDFSRKARDYVDGYFEIDNYGTQTLSSVEYGWVDVKTVPVGKYEDLDYCHPIEKVAWQYMKLERPDLLSPDASLGVGTQFLQVFLTLFQDIEQFAIGFYRACKLNGYGDRIDLGAEKPSFIRMLNPTGHKKGGGHRVKKIVYGDNWDDMSTDTNDDPEIYGQEYSYLLPNGESSGVASYEPIMGGEENPLKQPSELYSSVNGPKILRNKDLYQEKPYGEAYYPGASVGYSRVLVKSLKRLSGETEVNTKTKEGISVTQFYTARDFPVRVDQTAVYQAEYIPNPIKIPLFGQKNYQSNGYSQGYEVVLNDMHGKLWKQATYPAKAAVSSVYGTNIVNTSLYTPVAQTEYIYGTLGNFSQGGNNKLNNSVTVLDGDGISRSAVIGQTGENFIEVRENYSKSFAKQGEGNLDVFPFLIPALPIPSYWPYTTRCDNMFRSVVNNHIVYQTGILKKVKTTVNGSVSTAQNLMFDANTGTPLLTTVTNDFDKPIYTYNYPAYWAYNSMSGAYQNQAWVCNIGSAIGSGTVTIAASSNKFKEGDVLEVYLSNNTIGYCWVTAKTATTLTLKDEYGANYSSGVLTVDKLKVLRSGYRNQQSAGMGQIVSLEINPAEGRNQFFTALNDYLDIYNHLGNVDLNKLAYPNCEITGDTFKVEPVPVWTGTLSVVSSFTIPLKHKIGGAHACDVTIDFDQVLSDGIGDYRYYRNGMTYGVTAVNINTGDVITGTISDGFDCLKECALAGILHADATHYTDDWSFNYEDVDNPEAFENSSSKVAMTASLTATNPYRFGTKGIWRPLNSWAYITERNQNDPQTKNYADGTYDLFIPHNWAFNEKLLNPVTNPSYATSPSVVNNAKWKFISENTVYNPYGYVTEKVNAIGNYSAALYGYQNSVQTAVASNATYYETAFEGFEDHPLSGGGSNYLPNKPGHGHLKFGSGSTPLALSSQSHTGKFSYPVGSSGITYSCTPSSTVNFTPKVSSKYIVSAWFKTTAGTPEITCANGSNTVLTLGPKIDKWQKVDFVFETGAGTSTAYNIVFSFGSEGSGFVDDIRIQPYVSAMVSYVYNPLTLWNVAELDNRNFATFYIYDTEGSLVLVKKETEKGIVTIKSARGNVRRNPTP